MFADETRAGHQLQVELQRKLDEAETRVSELRRDLSHVEADKESELKRLRQKNADLEDAVAELSSTLTAQRNKQMSSETKAEIISATLREKSQQLCSLEEHVTSIEAKHARDLSRCKDQCSEADSRVEAFISELSGLRRRCDELELYKRNCDSRHKLDMQDVMNKLDSAVRDASNAQISKQNLEAEVDHRAQIPLIS